MQTPSTKVSAATIASVIAYAITWLVKSIWDVDIPEAVVAGLVGVITLVAGYFIPETNPAASSLPSPPQP